MNLKQQTLFSSAEPPFVDSHITCGRDFIQLDVKLNPKIWERVQSKLEMHLIDKYCKPFYVNSTHVSIRTPLYNCGTKLEVTKDHMIFSNSFMMSEEPEVDQLVSFIPDVEVKFRCTYGRKNITRRIGKVALWNRKKYIAALDLEVKTTLINYKASQASLAEKNMLEIFWYQPLALGCRLWALAYASS